ncbi:MAG: hypothetical protein QM727_03305 [Niabella sp.]
MLFLLPFSVLSQVKKLYISPKGAKGASQSMFIDSIRIIPLEKKANNKINSEYTYTFVTDSFFFVLSYVDKKISLFDKEGRFWKQVSYKNLGELNFYYVEQEKKIVFKGANKKYELTEKDGLQILTDFANPKNRKYFRKYYIDINDPTLTIHKSEITSYEILQATTLYDDYYYQSNISVSDKYKDSIDYELKIYKDNKLVKAFFPYNKQNEPRFLYSSYNNTMLASTEKKHEKIVLRPYSDTVYRFQNDSVSPIYKIVLPQENALPPSFFTEPFKNKTARENYERNNGWQFRQIYNFVENDRFIKLNIGFLNNYGSYIYDKKTTVLYDQSKIKADSSQYNLQLSLGSSSLFNGRYYMVVPLGALKELYKNNKNMVWPDYIRKIAADDNTRYLEHAIIEYKLKSE